MTEDWWVLLLIMFLDDFLLLCIVCFMGLNWFGITPPGWWFKWLKGKNQK